MKNKVIRNYKGYKKVNEEDKHETPFRLYGKGMTPQAELIKMYKSFINGIKKASPTDQESLDKIREDITKMKDTIMSHPNFEEFKDPGFEWQDQTIKASDSQAELKSAIESLDAKAIKKGLI
jgi:hypothetical protein